MMNRHVLRALAGLILGMTAIGASAQEPRVGAPLGATLVLDVTAQGVQIYTCELAADGLRWVFTAPDAALFDAAGRQVGTHFGGPTWQLEDGSKIVGEILAQAAAPEPHASAWLLPRVKSHAGSGRLGDVELVRRIDTQGGVAPTTPCSMAVAQARMRYTARYQFYAARR